MGEYMGQIFNSPKDANWYDRTMGHKPSINETKPSADRLLQSNYFKAFVKHSLKSSKSSKFEFMVEQESTKESVKMETNANSESEKNDSVFEVFGALKVAALWESHYRESHEHFLKRLEVDRDFNLEEIFPLGCFEGVLTPAEAEFFFESFFDACVHRWGLDGVCNPVFDDLPFGNIGQQILDGRFEKLFIFTQSRVSPAKMAQIAEKLFNTFSESFQEYNFYKNEILENICENMLSVLMDYIRPDHKFNKGKILDHLLRCYDQNRLSNIKDLRLLKKESDLLREGRRNSCINFAKKGQDSDASKSKRKDSFAQIKSLLLSRVLSRIIMVMVQAWPLYALHTDTDTLLQILRVMADWGNPLIPGAVTESLLRLIGTKRPIRPKKAQTKAKKKSKKLLSKKIIKSGKRKARNRG